MQNEIAKTRTKIMPVDDDVASAERALLDIAKRDTGGMSKSILTTIDTTTVAGRMHLARHLEHDQPKEAKANDGWYGVPFTCIAITSRGVVAKRGQDGEVYETPKPLIRTTLETDDGKILALNSSYVFEDVMQIRKDQPLIDHAHPVRLKLKKRGAADGIFRVWDEPVPAATSTQKAKASNSKG